MPPLHNKILRTNPAKDQGPVIILDLEDPGELLNDPKPTNSGPERSAPRTASDPPPSPATEAASASAPQASDPAARSTPPLNTANFVEPEWRGKKYITPEVFRRRVYAYFGRRPSLSTVHRWLHEGRIFAVRVNTRWLIPEGTWEEFLKCCKLGERF